MLFMNFMFTFVLLLTPHTPNRCDDMLFSDADGVHHQDLLFSVFGAGDMVGQVDEEEDVWSWMCRGNIYIDLMTVSARTCFWDSACFVLPHEGLFQSFLHMKFAAPLIVFFQSDL